VTVLNLQNDRYIPKINGAINPMVNARKVGKAKTGRYFLIAFSIKTSYFFLDEALDKISKIPAF
jgi:hypothetical protein